MAPATKKTVVPPRLGSDQLANRLANVATATMMQTLPSPAAPSPQLPLPPLPQQQRHHQQPAVCVAEVRPNKEATTEEPSSQSSAECCTLSYPAVGVTLAKSSPQLQQQQQYYCHHNGVEPPRCTDQDSSNLNQSCDQEVRVSIAVSTAIPCFRGAHEVYVKLLIGIMLPQWCRRVSEPAPSKPPTHRPGVGLISPHQASQWTTHQKPTSHV